MFPQNLVQQSVQQTAVVVSSQQHNRSKEGKIQVYGNELNRGVGFIREALAPQRSVATVYV